MATGAASVCSIDATKACDGTGEQNCCEKGSHVSSTVGPSPAAAIPMSAKTLGASRGRPPHRGMRRQPRRCPTMAMALRLHGTGMIAEREPFWQLPIELARQRKEGAMHLHTYRDEPPWHAEAVLF
jgi:hypothetical protein